jgi:hypothetical protein
MTLRYCPRCASEVEDVGGFCLLGHPLRLDPLIPSVSHIRDEIDRAFDEATPDEASPEEMVAGAGGESKASTGREPAPALSVVAVSVSPPPPPSRGPHSVWRALGDESGDASDPIAAFAPPAGMDWGPERPSLLDQFPRRRRGRPAPA